MYTGVFLRLPEHSIVTVNNMNNSFFGIEIIRQKNAKSTLSFLSLIGSQNEHYSATM
jgi:hypothetical protein